MPLMCSEMSLSYCFLLYVQVITPFCVTGFALSVRQKSHGGFICSKAIRAFFDFIPTLSYLLHWWDIMGSVMYWVQT